MLRKKSQCQTSRQIFPFSGTYQTWSEVKALPSVCPAVSADKRRPSPAETPRLQTGEIKGNKILCNIISRRFASSRLSLSNFCRHYGIDALYGGFWKSIMCPLCTFLIRVVGRKWSPASKQPPEPGLMWGWSYTTHLKVGCPAMVSFSHSPCPLHQPPP